MIFGKEIVSGSYIYLKRCKYRWMYLMFYLTPPIAKEMPRFSYRLAILKKVFWTPLAAKAAITL
jgi:hypothetical protein